MNTNSVMTVFNGEIGVYEVRFNPTKFAPKLLIDGILEAIALQEQHAFYNYNNRITLVENGRGPKVLNEKDLAGSLNDFMHIQEIRRESIKNRFPNKNELIIVLYAPRIKNALPELKLYTRSPVIDEEWRFHANPGYDEATGIYYDGQIIQRQQGTQYLNQVMQEMNWKTASDKAGFIAMLLTGLTMPLWIGIHPHLVINGNQPGVGKTLLAKILGIIVENKMPAIIRYESWESEFERQLGARLLTGDRTIILDNAKCNEKNPTASSQVLESMITSSVLTIRPLKTSEAFERPNDVIFCLTANGAKLSPDLQRRALPVNLEYYGDVRTKTYAIPNLEKFVMDHLPEITGELMNMVLSWVEAGKPLPESPANHSISQEWAATMDGILQYNGIEGFLENMEDSMKSFDPDYEIMISICQEFFEFGLATPQDWQMPMLSSRILEAQFTDFKGKLQSDRSIQTVIGQIFSRNANKVFEIETGKFQLVMEEPKGHRSRRYGFKSLTGQKLRLAGND